MSYDMHKHCYNSNHLHHASCTPVVLAVLMNLFVVPLNEKLVSLMYLISIYYFSELDFFSCISYLQNKKHSYRQHAKQNRHKNGLYTSSKCIKSNP